MRIVVSTPTFLPVVGGAELGIHEIYHRLGQRHDVTILTPPLPKSMLERYGAGDYTSRNYQIRHISPRLERSLPAIGSRALRRTSLLYSAALSREVLRARPDAINFHFVRPHGTALLLARRLWKVPVALSLVGRLDVLRLLPTPQRRFAEMIIANADLTLPNSTYYLGARPQDARIRVIPYGVDTQEYSPSHRDGDLRRSLGLGRRQFVLLSVQRLAPVKRVDLVVRAMSKVVARNPDVVLVVGGQGEEEQSLRRLVSELGLSDNVRFAGYIARESLPRYFAAADAFAFHSLVETFGIVFAQAMASGLPIIAASTSCVPDVLTSDNGLLVEPFNTDAFADAILTLADDRERARQIGEHNRALAARDLDWDFIATQYEQALRDIATPARSRRLT